MFSVRQHDAEMSVYNDDGKRVGMIAKTSNLNEDLGRVWHTYLFYFLEKNQYFLGNGKWLNTSLPVSFFLYPTVVFLDYSIFFFEKNIHVFSEMENAFLKCIFSRFIRFKLYSATKRAHSRKIKWHFARAPYVVWRCQLLATRLWPWTYVQTHTPAPSYEQANTQKRSSLLQKIKWHFARAPYVVWSCQLLATRLWPWTYVQTHTPALSWEQANTQKRSWYSQ